MKKKSTALLLRSCGFLLTGALFAGSVYYIHEFGFENVTQFLQQQFFTNDSSREELFNDNMLPENSATPSPHSIFKENIMQIPEASQSDWKLLLINPWNTLPQNFSVQLKKLRNGHAVDKRIYPDLQQMMDDARAAGLNPLICSSYRSNDRQKTLYENKVRNYISQGYSPEQAYEAAATWVSVPGTSEHQTGLAIDIVAMSYQLLDSHQENTAEQKWLMKNSWKYGFILRYPNDKSEITGVNYEPWHYRYVGKKAAKEIFEQNLCLEEYLQR